MTSKRYQSGREVLKAFVPSYRPEGDGNELVPPAGLSARMGKQKARELLEALRKDLPKVPKDA